MVSDSLGLPVPDPRILPFWPTMPSATHTLTGQLRKGEPKHFPERGHVMSEAHQVSCLARESEPRSPPGVPCDLDHLVLYVLCEALLQRLSDHRDLVPGQQGNR